MGLRMNARVCYAERARGTSECTPSPPVGTPRRVSPSSSLSIHPRTSIKNRSVVEYKVLLVTRAGGKKGEKEASPRVKRGGEPWHRQPRGRKPVRWVDPGGTHPCDWKKGRGGKKCRTTRGDRYRDLNNGSPPEWEGFLSSFFLPFFFPFFFSFRFSA